MLRALLLWLLLGSLGLVAYDAFTARTSPDKAYVMDGGNGLPTPPPRP